MSLWRGLKLFGFLIPFMWPAYSSLEVYINSLCPRVLKYYNVPLWGPVFIHCAWDSIGPLDLTTQVLQLGEIFLNYFIGIFLCSIYVVLSFWSFYYLDGEPSRTELSLTPLLFPLCLLCSTLWENFYSYILAILPFYFMIIAFISKNSFYSLNVPLLGHLGGSVD